LRAAAKRDGVDDALVASAAAEVRGDRLADVGLLGDAFSRSSS
jgi:hypothetical protein